MDFVSLYFVLVSLSSLCSLSREKDRRKRVMAMVNMRMMVMRIAIGWFGGGGNRVELFGKNPIFQ